MASGHPGQAGEHGQRAAQHNQAADTETHGVPMGTDGGAVDEGRHEGFSLAETISTNPA